MKYLLLIFVATLFTGCQGYGIVSPDGWRFDIDRTMTDAQFESLEVETPEGFKLHVEGLKSETQQVVEAAVRAAIEGARP